MMNGLRWMVLSLASSAGCSAPVEKARDQQPPAALTALAPRHVPASRGHVWVIVPRDVVSLHATQSGRVMNVHRRVGDRVKVNDALLTLEGGPAQDALVVSATRLREGQADMEVARVEEARSRGKLEQVEQLFREAVASQRQLADATSRAHAAATFRPTRRVSSICSAQMRPPSTASFGGYVNSKEQRQDPIALKYLGAPTRRRAPLVGRSRRRRVARRTPAARLLGVSYPGLALSPGGGRCRL